MVGSKVHKWSEKDDIERKQRVYCIQEVRSLAKDYWSHTM